jgi:predicted regulator of Ras-like GTPase activity (Roadblock/LC7/MglB family)
VARSPAPAAPRSNSPARGGTDTIDLSATPLSLISGAPQLPSAPPPLPLPTSHSALDPLCAEPGVQGALVVDSTGRVVIGKGLEAEAELLAALSLDVTTCGIEALGTIGSKSLASWSIATGRSQILAYRRDGDLSLIVKAEAGCKQALLELRARQALIDLGANA